MKSLIDYPINFPYGATTAPYSPAHPHRGNDRACPTGTPIIVAGTTIGLVGSTGLATGPHCHIQEWRGNNSIVRKPQNEFKAGVVTSVGWHNQFGNFVNILNPDGWTDTYAHMSKIIAVKGQQIGGDMAEKLSLSGARILAEEILGRDRDATHSGKGDGDLNANHVGKDLTNAYLYSLWTSDEAKNASALRQAQANFYNTYKSSIAELSGRPTKAKLEEMGKQLADEQKAVEQAEKALQEAKDKASEDTKLLDETGNWLTKLFNRLFKRS